MNGLLNSLSQMPWYGWVAIVAIVAGLVGRVMVRGRS